jgi:hypothetical protein
MTTNFVQVGIETDGVSVRQRVSISRWVNEPYPAWDQILTAHDVARLIRRPPWVLSSMAVVGQFPRKQRFRGKSIGWLKADILEWMTFRPHSKVATTSEDITSSCRRNSDRPGQQALPLEYASSCPSTDLSTVSHFAGVSP